MKAIFALTLLFGLSAQAETAHLPQSEAKATYLDLEKRADSDKGITQELGMGSRVLNDGKIECRYSVDESREAAKAAPGRFACEVKCKYDVSSTRVASCVESVGSARPAKRPTAPAGTAPQSSAHPPAKPGTR